jgi:outer membrane protein assembly factor BamB
LAFRPAGYGLPAPIQRTVAVLDGGKVLIAGGLDASNTTVGGVFLLNPVTGNLTSSGSLARPVHDATGQMIGSRLFVFGGGASASTDAVQVFDPRAGTSTIAGHLPVPLSDLGSASVGGTTYLVGGYDGHSPRREIYATTDGTTFSKAGMLPVGLRYAAVTSAGSQMIIAGGQRTNGPSSEIFAFDPAQGSIRRIGKLPAPVGHALAFFLEGTVYVAGGVDASGEPVTAVTAVDPATGHTTAENGLSQPLSDAAVATGGQDAIVIGGARGTTALDQVLIASVQTRTVTASSSQSASGSAATTSAEARAKRRPFAGLLLIADRGNNRLLVMNSRKHILWRYPSPKLPAPPHPLYFPDDAFWVHGGRAILVNEEENHTVLEIAYPSGRLVWTYGHPKVAGSSFGYLNQPDDIYPYPGGGAVVADAKNCRILFFDRNGVPSHQIGTNGVCAHGFPNTVGYPNGDTPLQNGHLLISELIGHWVDEVTKTGRVIWAHQVPGVVEPSDPQPLADGTFMVASYAFPGAVVRFNRAGKVLWYYHPTSGPGVLDHPSLATPLPNGLVAVNDDYNHRVILIDPKTNKIVWAYGTGVAGSSPGQLSFPDGIDLMLPGNVIPLHVDFRHRPHAGMP